MTVNEGVRKIRDKYKRLRKKYEFSDVYMTMWDADAFRLSHLKKDVVLQHPNGTKINLVTNLDNAKKELEPGVVRVYPDFIVASQFLPSEMKSNVVAAAVEFGGEIKDYSEDKDSSLTTSGLNEMISFCREMDKEILSVIESLKKNKVKNIVESLLLEMDAPNADKDIVVKRLLSMKLCVDSFRSSEGKDRALWMVEMQRLGFSVR